MNKKLKILIVDDEADIRIFADSFLTKRGHDVRSVDKGEEALDILDKEQFDLLILDLTLDGIPGKDVLSRLRAHNNLIKVIIITGHHLLSNDEKREITELGVEDIIIKPLSLADIESKICDIFGIPHTRDVSVQEAPIERRQTRKRLIEPEFRHDILNMLNQVRGEAEILLLDKEDGFHNSKSDKELLDLTFQSLHKILAGIERISETLKSSR